MNKKIRINDVIVSLRGIHLPLLGENILMTL